jgi:DNA-binding SARP family transcriptional activator
MVLGPLEVHGDNGSLDLGSPKERRLLAMLVASRGEVVSADVLVEGIWDGRPPRTAAKTLQAMSYTCDAS